MKSDFRLSDGYLPRNSRKTECGASKSLPRDEVRAAPFALFKRILQPAFLGAIVVFAVLVPFLAPQGPPAGSIAGAVTDSTGAILADAKVSLTSPALVVAQSTL